MYLWYVFNYLGLYVNVVNIHCWKSNNYSTPMLFIFMVRLSIFLYIHGLPVTWQYGGVPHMMSLLDKKALSDSTQSLFICVWHPSLTRPPFSNKNCVVTLIKILVKSQARLIFFILDCVFFIMVFNTG